jgi:sialate O-acetylesterase
MSFPFYFVQIAPYNYGENHFDGAKLEISKTQYVSPSKKTGMVITRHSTDDYPKH